MARFGKQDTVGLDTNAPGGTGRAVLTRFELTEAGTLNHVAIYSTGSNAGLVKGLVYADNAGEPGAQVAVGDAVAVEQNDWAISECSGEALTPGLYWIGVISQDYLSSMRVASSGGTGWVQWGNSGYDNPPDPWSGGSAAGYILGAYADYDPGGGPPDGAIEGTAALAFTVVGAVDQPPPGPIAGSTGLGLSASAAPTLPPSPAPTFAGETANGTLTNGSRRLIHNGGAGNVANCIASEPIVGKQYFETLQHIEAAGSLPHGSVYGDTDYALTTSTHLGIWYAHYGAAAAFTSANNNHLYANGGGVGAIGSAPGTPPKSVVMRWAVDADTREVWVRRSDLPSWVGGGDPEAGTSPSFVLGGDGPIYPAAGVGAEGGDPGDAWTDLLTEAEQVGAVPDGFTNYMSEDAPPPGGDIAGTTGLTLTASGTPSADGTVQIAGTTAVSFAAALAQDVPYFGNTTPGIGGTWSGNAGRIIASRFELTEPASTLTFYQHFGYNADDSGNDPGGVDWVGMVFADDAGEPGDVVAVSQVATSTGSGRWQPATLSAQLQPGFYWLGTQTASFSLTINTTTPAEGGTPDNIRRAEGSSLAIAPGDPWPGTASTGTGDLTAYVIYSPLPPPSQIEGATSFALAVQAALAGAGSLAGTTGLTLAARAAPSSTQTVQAAGTTDLAVTTSAAPSATGALSGAASLSLAAQAAPRAAGRIQGGTGLVTGASAQLQAAGALAGATDINLAASAAPSSTQIAQAAGATGLALATSAALRATGTLAGGTGLSWAAAARPTSGTDLGGSTTLAWTGAARLQAAGALAGSAGLSWSASARPTSGTTLGGSTSFVLTTSAAPVARGALAGAATLDLAASAAAHARAQVAGEVAFSWSTSAAPEVAGALYGATGLALASGGQLRATGALAGVAPVSLRATAAPGLRVALAGGATISFTGSAEPPTHRARTVISIQGSARLGGRAGAQGRATLSLSGTASPAGGAQRGGTADLTLGATGQAKAALRAEGRALLSWAASGAMLARVYGRGDAAATFALQGVMAGDGRLAGAAALRWRAALAGEDVFACEPTVVVLTDPAPVVVALLDSAPTTVVLLDEEPTEAPFGSEAPTTIIVSC